ncbi:CRTAC1 family protein [Alloacidobacterium sp.]|uniref:CRTAC1 family protein n=1 Tax=Alloacidobacterium sp. TaxID=2951999 RepID=UPI002D569B34|nr:CRTAC1 family protein [Alloacidobacterium sp.]HYK35540.1 CRTAC1 family protein [Alloacidobacterium sp.]
MGGNATGGVHAPVHDAENRPITAGGFVDSGPVIFQDISKQAGLTVWRHQMGVPEKQFIIETNGSGVGLIDYDNDGWLDIYLVNGSTYEAEQGKATAPHAALFHNNHDGTFTNVAEKAGVTNDRWGFGVAIGDYDNDGWPDIFVGNYGKNRLYHNNHDGTFTDVAEKAGVTLGNWSTGATFGDYDGDGRLDLFVPGYIHYDMSNPPVPGTKAVGFSGCQFRGVATMCGPRGLQGEHDHLFHNNGNGTFTDVGEKAGVSDPNAYYGFSSIFVDLNNDGKVDLIVADDSTPNYLYINKGNGTFEDDSYASGFALNQDGREIAGMGIAVGDYQNNGLLDIVATDFSDDYKVLFHNDGDANFTDVSYHAGIAQESIPFLGWGVGFIDYDNDGWKDIFMVNGHVYPQVDKYDWGTSFAERPLLYHNMKGQKFEYVPPVKGTGLADVVAGRGAAFGDLFNDGKIDVVISVMDSTPVLLRNVNADNHHWVEMKLIGGPKSPRDAVGATVYLTAGGIKRRDDVLSGGSYISSNDQRVHFGLGETTKVDQVEIHWPSGAVEKLSLPNIDRIYTVQEGKGIVGELCTACEKSGKESKSK